MPITPKEIFIYLSPHKNFDHILVNSWQQLEQLEPIGIDIYQSVESVDHKEVARAEDVRAVELN